MLIQEFLSLLNGVRQSGKEYSALCPAHDDNNQSLSITKENEKIVLYCHRGCKTEDVVTAMGLKMRDLFQKPKGGQAGKAPRGKIAATYDYHDKDGRLQFQAVRMEPKNFRQRKPDGEGGWDWNIKGIKPVIYRLPEVLAAVKSGKPVYITEGEKDADNLRALGLVATTNPMGAGKWKPHHSEFLIGARVIILPDNDEAGKEHALKVAKSLYGKAAAIKIVTLPGLPQKGDVSDWLKSGGTKKKLFEIHAAAPAWEPPAGELQKKESFLPQIMVTARPLRELSDQAIKALVAANNPPTLFTRGCSLTKIVLTEEKDRNNSLVKRPIIKVLSEAALRGCLDRAADFKRYDRKGENEIPCPPPRDVVQDIMALDAWPFPLLQGATQSPILRQDGSIVMESGYDPVTSLYYLPDDDLVVPGIPENLSEQDVANARDLLLEVVCDFPFDSEASRANALAALFTPVLRDLIPGPVPMAALDKPQQGTGASLLVDCISQIATGKPAYMMTAPEGREKEEEWRKRATSVLLEGRPIVVIDNVEGRLQSAVLGALLTCTYWQDRALGRNELISILHRTTWFLTGNNVRLAGDMPRRCYKVRLDAKQPRPWQRDSKSYKHPRLLEWVKDTRGELLGAILILAKAWIMAGRPLPEKLPNLGSFEDWTRIIGGILGHAGVSGFLQNLEDLYDQSEDDEGWCGFLAAWCEKWTERAVTTADIKNELLRDENFASALPDELDPSDKGFTRRLGHALKARIGRHYQNGLIIEKCGTVSRATSWRVRGAEEYYKKVSSMSNMSSLPSTHGEPKEVTYIIDGANNSDNTQNSLYDDGEEIY